MAKKRFSDFTEEPRSEPQYPVAPPPTAAAPPPLTVVPTPAAPVPQNEPEPEDEAIAAEAPAKPIAKETKALARDKKAAAAPAERALPRMGRKPVYEVPMQPFSSRISQDNAEMLADLNQETGKPVTRLLDEALGLLRAKYRSK